MLFVDAKYANLLSVRLRNFRKKGDFLWNFSCPICGDSKKNPHKARGYIFRWKDSLRVKCHNCDYSEGMRGFLQEVDENLFSDYVVEVFKESHSSVPVSKPKKITPKIPKEEEVVDTVLDGATRLDRLPADHPAPLYIRDRKLPEDALKLLYYVPRFKKYVNTILPRKFDPVVDDHPRLIIPYFNKHGGVFTMQGRAFGDEEPRYMTIKITPEASRVFGLERIDASKRIYAVEGPLDSLCIPNAIAVSGSSFGSATLELLKANLTVVFDNEPRNPEITKLLRRTIKKGFSVCIWPDNIEQKDINDMIRFGGMSPKDVIEVIDKNTFRGPSALMKFTIWSKTHDCRKDRKSMSRS